MKKIFLSMKMLCISLLPLINSMYDSEFETMLCAAQSRNEQANGLQGCINKEKCDEYGFYLAEYSPEGLCKKCEFNHHPERFIACLLCRKPTKKLSSNMLSFSCLGCQSDIKKFLVKRLLINNDGVQRNILEMGAFIYFEKMENVLSKKYIKSFIDIKNTIGFSSNAKVLFYLGAKRLENGNLLHAWSKDFNVDPDDKKLVSNWDEAEEHVRCICEKYNIFGPETGTLITQNLPDDILTYEEIADK